MPKIKGTSVPAHRAAQRLALLNAARAAILRDGLASLTFGALADSTGLARPSVYEYFRTKSELLVALITEDMPAWRSAVAEGMSRGESPEDALAAFVRVNLELVKAGRHELSFALTASDLDEEARAAIGSAHREVFSLLVPHLKDLGVSDIGTSVELVAGVIMTAGQSLRQNPRRRHLIGLAVTFAVGGIRACIKHGRITTKSSVTRIRRSGTRSPAR
jgi:AcrR family transcriptional regulator